MANAIGGAGDDLIIPNGNLIGTLTGGGGNDTFQGTQAGLNLYTITDVGFGDKINFTDANLANFIFTLVGSELHYGNNIITLSNNPNGIFQLTADLVAGVDLTLIPPAPSNPNQLPGPQIMYALTGHTESSQAQFDFHTSYVPVTIAFYTNVVHSSQRLLWDRTNPSDCLFGVIRAFKAITPR